MPPTKLGAGDFGAEVALVHATLAKHGIAVSQDEQKRQFFGPTTREAVGKFQAQRGIDPTGEVSEKTAAMLAGAVPNPKGTERGRNAEADAAAARDAEAKRAERGKEVSASRGVGGKVGTETAGTPPPVPSSAGAASARVTGTIELEHGAAASQVMVRIYNRAFGGTKTLLAEAKSGADGTYEVPYSATGDRNIEVYVVGADGQDVQLSQTKYGATADERIDLIAPSRVQPDAAEFARLKADIAPQMAGKPETIKGAIERGERRDFTFLANTTGWDPGALALASEAFAAAERTKIPAEGLYALARAGLPTDARLLAHASKQMVASALRQAAEAGVVDATIVDGSIKAFVNFAADFKFSTSIDGATSSPKDFVAKARVSDADKTAFAAVVKDDSSSGVWERAKAGGVSDDGIAKLQTQGKLAYLTFNNADLTDYLASIVGSDPLALISLGYYEESKWEEALRRLSGGDPVKLDALIPTAFSGRNVDERMRTYVVELARRVRQMDPHAVTMDRISTGKIDGVPERDGVASFLKNASALGFRLGKTSLSGFVAKNADAVWAGVPAERRDDVLSSVRSVSSLYATSTDDDALGALLRAGFKSATAIARYDYPTFLDKFKKYHVAGPKFGDTNVTEKIFWKAQQQSATVFNVFDGLKRLSNIGAAPGSTPHDVELRNDRIVKAREKLSGLFPTLESLFGSVDYCECSQCRSVLSPAAYLVDILHFIDPNQEAWETVLASYQARTGFAYKGIKPFEALNRRRPDIKNIALTCENTNVALPYIDIVNEVLEQVMMADSTPPVIEAYDVGDLSSADLLAEPQNVLWSAYVGAPGKPGLRDRVHPLTLPFDLPLEMARAFLNGLGLPLWRLREVLARPSTLNASLSNRSDGWTNVWFERLGLGARDVTALTTTDKWYELYGFETQDAALKLESAAGGTRPASGNLRNAKTLSRRLDISYEALVDLVRTRFLNPDIENLITLQRLGIDPSMIDRYCGEAPPLSAAEKSDLEAELLAEGFSPANLGPLRSTAIRKRTVVLQSPSVGCDFGETTLGFDVDPDDGDQSIVFLLRKLNAFVRLQKRLGWDTNELDRVLAAVMPAADKLSMTTWPDAMQSALVRIAHVEDLRERFEGRASREEICLLWGDIPTVGMACFYDRLFPAKAGPGHDSAFDKRLGRVLEDKTITLNGHTDAIRQAFQLTHDDVEPILLAAGAADRSLSISNLSILVRYAVLARGLGWAIAELLSLLRLSERKPLSSLGAPSLTNLTDDTAWTETIAFVREAVTIGKAGADVATIDRICRGQSEDADPPSGEDPTLVALAALPSESTPEKYRALVVQTLAAQLSSPEVVVDHLLGSVLIDVASGKPLKEVGFDSPAHTATSVRKLRKALALMQALGTTAGELEYLGSVSDALSPNDLPVDAVTDDAIARQIYKGMAAWLDLVATRKQLGRSERLLAVLSAAKQSIDPTNTSAVRQQHLIDALSALTGYKPAWLPLALDAVGATSTGSAAFEVVQLASPTRLIETIDALKCFARLGLSPKDVVDFVSTVIDDVAAGRLRASLKGRYSTSAWRRLAKPIFDGLRKRQRDALVAHLTHVMDGDTPKYGDTAERLFECLLLDPGMEPVVIASRVQLAINSVQLFVQRCLLNLEQEVDPQIIDTKRWDWMRRYRVWEVNRKMFIWPENWLDPEFRDDKTHLFRELEGTLLQGDVSDDLVRTSFYTYLKGLEEIARLEMLTMYFEPGASADGSIVHVVGRTPNAPNKYFYRSYSHGMWTPWEPIDVGIEGEHLVLTSWRGRLHLFWLSFLDQTQESKNIPDTFAPATQSVSTTALRGTRQVKLQLHWVEQVQGKWTNRNSTPHFVETSFNGFVATTADEKRAFFVRAVIVGHEAGIEDDDLEIQVTANNVAHKFVLFSKLAPPRSEKSGDSPNPPPFELTKDPGQATKWRGDGALSVNFVSAITQSSQAADQILGERTHKILGGGGEFTLLFPSNEALPIPARVPPVGVGRLSGYTFQPQNAHHVCYRGGDGSVYDLYGSSEGWFVQSASADAASSGAPEDTEAANSDPHGYALDERGTICIAYAGTTKIHELIWSQLDTSLDDPEQLGTGWRLETLYQGVATQDQPAGRPLGGLFIPARGVVFRTRDNRLRAVVETSADPGWEIRELGVGLPTIVGEPTGMLVTKTELAITTVVSRHVFYLGSDGHVHELRSDLAGKTWTHTNITQSIAGVVFPAAGAALAAYAFLGQGTLHVVYRGTDDRIHELWSGGASWNHNAIGASFTKAKGDPSGYVTESFGTQHVVYRGEGDEVVELWGSDTWNENVLTKATSYAVKTATDVTGYSFEPGRTQHVVYFADDGSPRQLWWNLAGWKTDGYELKNPFPDDLGPLAAPFFYEAGRKDHAFFVEPYVVETAVHEWTEWIVTTKTYVPLQPPKYKLTPLRPNVVALAPSNVGIIKGATHYEKTLFGKDAIIRTLGGVIGPMVEMKGLVAETKLIDTENAGQSSGFVDVRSGTAAKMSIEARKNLGGRR